jgi:hypothetical protein
VDLAEVQAYEKEIARRCGAAVAG